MRSPVLCLVALVSALLLATPPSVEGGKSSKRMIALALLSMMNKNQKVIIPFPVPMPVKVPVYEKKDYYYPKEEYPMHHYGDEGFGHHHGGGGYDKGHNELSHGHGFESGAHHAHHHAHHSGASYSAHPIVNTYDGKVGNEYGAGGYSAGGGSIGNEYGSGGGY